MSIRISVIMVFMSMQILKTFQTSKRTRANPGLIAIKIWNRNMMVIISSMTSETHPNLWNYFY